MKAEALPKIGDTVVDGHLKPIGTVFDVLGPVSSPYIAVKPAISEPQRLVKSILYTIPPTGRRKEKKYHGR